MVQNIQRILAYHRKNSKMQIDSREPGPITLISHKRNEPGITSERLFPARFFYDIWFKTDLHLLVVL